MYEISYVLIHGGHNDGSVWDSVVPYLKSAGHNVFTPTLADPKETTLDGHISEVCDLIEKIRSEKIILAGHSYGAMVITGVFARIPERILRLIYLDSVFPKSGDSLFGIMQRCGALYQTFGLTPERPFTDPLIFDEGIVLKIPKTYVHCTNSEFLAVGKCAYANVRKNRERDNWVCYELKSPHNCMKAMPGEVADILLLR